MKHKDGDEKETPLCHRSYGKNELAALYLPDTLPQSAMKLFNEWIVSFPGLTECLRATGLRVRAKRHTPAQVVLIMEALGEPRWTGGDLSGPQPMLPDGDCICAAAVLYFRFSNLSE